jgi:hypothetical protein
MTDRHTPGPWKAAAHIVYAGDHRVATVQAVGARANRDAELIAEAPAMLTALRMLLEDCEAHGLTDNDAHLREARAILARIDGEA